MLGKKGFANVLTELKTYMLTKTNGPRNVLFTWNTWCRVGVTMEILNKELCLKCFRSAKGKMYEEDYFFTEELFHTYWKMARCLCKAHPDDSLFWDIYTTPPDNCFYLLEQLMSQEHGE